MIPNAAVARIVEYDVSPIIAETQLLLQPLRNRLAVNFILLRLEISQADNCQNESRVMSAGESHIVVVIVLNSDIGLGFTQDFRAEL